MPRRSECQRRLSMTTASIYEWQRILGSILRNIWLRISVWYALSSNKKRSKKNGFRPCSRKRRHTGCRLWWPILKKAIYFLLWQNNHLWRPKNKAWSKQSNRSQTVKTSSRINDWGASKQSITPCVLNSSKKTSFTVTSHIILQRSNFQFFNKIKMPK